MLACDSQDYLLEHFLQIDTKQPELWLSTLQRLTVNSKLSGKLLPAESQAKTRVRLSALSSTDLDAYGIFTEAACQISGTSGSAVTVFMPVESTVSFNLADNNYLCIPWSPFILGPHTDFQAGLPEETHLLIVQVSGFENNVPFLSSGPEYTQLTKILSAFVLDSLFFQDYQHAQNCLQSFAVLLQQFFTGGLPEGSGYLLDRQEVWKERRLCKAIQLMNQELQKEDISIELIARRSGLSLRNFHYLMKEYTGLSPYQYIRGRRLIRVREALIRDWTAPLGIADYAREWGFQHAGRFANYYHRYFGEYPHQTLRKQEQLRQFV